MCIVGAEGAGTFKTRCIFGAGVPNMLEHLFRWGANNAETLERMCMLGAEYAETLEHIYIYICRAQTAPERSNICAYWTPNAPKR